MTTNAVWPKQLASGDRHETVVPQQYIPAGYGDAAHVTGVDASGNTEAIRELLGKTRALTNLARYARDARPGSLVTKYNKALHAKKDDGTALFSAFLSGRLDHAAGHAHTLCIIASVPGEKPFTAMAPHMRAIIEDALTVCWVLDPSANDGERFIRFGQFAIADASSVKNDPQLPDDFDLEGVKKTLSQRFSTRSVVGTGNDKARAAARERVREAPPGRALTARTLFDENVAAAWYRLSADSHYSQLWDQVLLDGATSARAHKAAFNLGVNPVNRREDAIRNYAATLKTLDRLLSETVRVLEFSEH